MDRVRFLFASTEPECPQLIIGLSRTGGIRLPSEEHTRLLRLFQAPQTAVSGETITIEADLPLGPHHTIIPNVLPSLCTRIDMKNHGEDAWHQIYPEPGNGHRGL